MIVKDRIYIILPLLNESDQRVYLEMITQRKWRTQGYSWVGKELIIRLKDVHYSEICKSELRRSYRRAAMCIENIFFKVNYCLGNHKLHCKSANWEIEHLLQES